MIAPLIQTDDDDDGDDDDDDDDDIYYDAVFVLKNDHSLSGRAERQRCEARGPPGRQA